VGFLLAGTDRNESAMGNLRILCPQTCQVV
jgi:hypothetical protein